MSELQNKMEELVTKWPFYVEKCIRIGSYSFYIYKADSTSPEVMSWQSDALVKWVEQIQNGEHPKYGYNDDNDRQKPDDLIAFESIEEFSIDAVLMALDMMKL